MTFQVTTKNAFMSWHFVFYSSITEDNPCRDSEQTRSDWIFFIRCKLVKASRIISFGFNKAFAIASSPIEYLKLINYVRSNYTRQMVVNSFKNKGSRISFNSNTTKDLILWNFISLHASNYLNVKVSNEPYRTTNCTNSIHQTHLLMLLRQS